MDEDNGMTAQRTALSPAAASRSREVCPVCGVAFEESYAGQRPCMESWAGGPPGVMQALFNDLERRGCLLFNRSRLKPAAASEAPCAEAVNNTIAESGDNRRG